MASHIIRIIGTLESRKPTFDQVLKLGLAQVLLQTIERHHRYEYDLGQRADEYGNEEAYPSKRTIPLAAGRHLVDRQIHIQGKLSLKVVDV
jgi:hypothetical protein